MRPALGMRKRPTLACRRRRRRGAPTVNKTTREAAPNGSWFSDALRAPQKHTRATPSPTVPDLRPIRPLPLEFCRFPEQQPYYRTPLQLQAVARPTACPPKRGHGELRLTRLPPTQDTINLPRKQLAAEQRRASTYSQASHPLRTQG